jgi:hypothetical protein
MRGNILVDLRNVYQPALAETAGFIYCRIGRGMSRKQTSKKRSAAKQDA